MIHWLLDKLVSAVLLYKASEVELVYPKSSGFLLVCADTLEYGRLAGAGVVGCAPESYSRRQERIQSVGAEKNLEVHLRQLRSSETT